MDEIMKAGKFKAECLQVMDKVRKSRRSIILTKRNVPVAKLVPIDDSEEKIFGSMKGTVHFIGDIMKPIDEDWNAAS